MSDLFSISDQRHLLYISKIRRIMVMCPPAAWCGHWVRCGPCMEVEHAHGSIRELYSSQLVACIVKQSAWQLCSSGASVCITGSTAQHTSATRASSMLRNVHKSPAAELAHLHSGKAHQLPISPRFSRISVMTGTKSEFAGHCRLLAI